MYTIYSYSDLEKIQFDKKLIIELKKEIKNIHECVGKHLEVYNFNIKEYGKIVVINNKIEFKKLVTGHNSKLCLFNVEAEQWIIDNDIYYILNGVIVDNGLFIEIIIREELYRKLDVTDKYYIEHNLKKIKNNNGKIQTLSY